jgi:uncharacterized membrane protein YebE (DUF533 family)
MAKTKDLTLSARQSHAIARAMYATATIDKITAEERALIKAFYNETAGGGAQMESFAQMRKSPFSASKLKRALGPDPAIAALLIESCVLVAYADGSYTDKEREFIASLAKDLGVSAKRLQTIHDGIVDLVMGQLAHIANTDALVEVRRELSGAG